MTKQITVLTGWGRILGAAALGLGLAAACGGQTNGQQKGSDGASHWLEDCAASSECGGLDCLCGKCTRQCTGTAVCSDLNAEAVCVRATGPTCQLDAPETVCALPGLGDAGPASSPDASPPPSTGAGGSPGPTQGAGGSPGPTQGAGGSPGNPDCSPMDAMSDPRADCDPNEYAWDGARCTALCACLGSDCDDTFTSEAACLEAYDGCFNNLCDDQERAVGAFISGNGDCESALDCTTLGAECGDNGCANLAYVNRNTDVDALTRLTSQLNQCSGSPSVCAVCESFAAPPSCQEGQCAPQTECANEHQAMLGFLEANKSCETTADCTTDFVGCGFSEDGCTQAVYVNQATDVDALAALRTELGTCLGNTDMCPGAACARIESPSACVEGRCVNASEAE